MDFGKLKKAQQELQDQEDAAREASSARFRTRLRGQRFLRDFAPLVALEVEVGANDDEFARRVLQSETLALALCRAVNPAAGENPKQSLVMAYRHQASEIVARAWRHGNDVDETSVARVIAACLDLVDGPEDAISELSPEASLYVSLLPIKASLAEVVSQYDFRMGPANVSRHLIDVVERKAKSLVGSLADEGFRESDRRTMIQTAVRAYGSTMRSVYRRNVVDYLRRFLTLDESEKLRILDVERPVERIVSEFHLRASLYEERAFLGATLVHADEAVPDEAGVRAEDGMRHGTLPPER